MYHVRRIEELVEQWELNWAEWSGEERLQGVVCSSRRFIYLGCNCGKILPGAAEAVKTRTSE
jgi:hypothetical protein